MTDQRILAMSNGIALLCIFGIIAVFLIVGGWMSKHGKDE